MIRLLTSLDYWEIWTRIKESGAAPLQALTTSKDDFVGGKRTWIRQQLCAVIVVQIVQFSLLVTGPSRQDIEIILKVRTCDPWTVSA